jgi:hypothetical protein
MANSKDVTALDKFATNMEDFVLYLERLFENCSQHSGLSTLGAVFKLGVENLKSYSNRENIELFIKNSEIHWNRIFHKDKGFFINNMDSMFSGTTVKNMGLFKRLLTAKTETGKRVVTTEDREIIWTFMHAFVRIALDFIHTERLPYVKVEHGQNGEIIKRTPVYGKKYFNSVDLKKHYTLWRTNRPDFRRHFKVLK